MSWLAAMATFVLVHGSWHGAWCWYRIVPRLEHAGHRVVALDLPSLGRDSTPPREVTLDLWADHVAREIDAAGEPVILVGHSRGGLVISAAAERRPEKVRKLVYVCAFLLRNGETLIARAETDTESQVLPNLVPAPDGVTSTIRDEAIRSLFYQECSDEDVALARLCLKPEPMAPLATPLGVTEARFGSVPREYVECLRDRTLTIGFQRKVVADSPCQRVASIDTDHSPFFSRPDELAKHLLAAAADGTVRA